MVPIHTIAYIFSTYNDACSNDYYFDSHSPLFLQTLLPQASRFSIGNIVNSMTWLPNTNVILWQTKIGSLVLSILLDEHANLGIAEENIKSLIEILRPLVF